jgi:cytochrome b561
VTLSQDHDSAQAKPHGVVAKILHWATAGLLLFAYVANGDVTNALRDPAAMRMEAMLGLGIVAVFGLRLLWMARFNGGATRLPGSAPKWEHRASRLAHHAMYLCVAAIVATGLLIPAALAWATPFWVDVARDVHEFMTNLTLFVIGAHVAAALWHKLVRRDGIWESIGTPWWQPKAGWFRRWRAAP